MCFDNNRKKENASMVLVLNESIVSRLNPVRELRKRKNEEAEKENGRNIHIKEKVFSVKIGIYREIK